MTNNVLITGSGGPAGVNVMRSLKESPEPPYIVGTELNNYHIEFTNSVADAGYLVPRCTATNYVEELNKIIDKHKIGWVHPQPDVEVKAISENRDKLNAKPYLPSKETVRICQDKHESANIWAKAGFPSVKSIEIRLDHLEDDIDAAFSEFGNKLWFRASEGAGGIGSTPADNPEVAKNWIRYWAARGKTSWKWMAQEYLPGLNVAFQSIWKDGELITSQARERVEYIYPYLAPSGVTGTPVVARALHNEKVNDMATQAVQAVDKNASGVFCVDIKFNNDGQAMPTEINVGRFFTTSYGFSYAAGVYKRDYANMPWLLMKLAFDEKIPDNIPKYNALPANLYWIRHIDCGHYLVPEDKIVKNPFN